MGFFSRKKNEDFVDLTGRYNRQKEKAEEIRKESQSISENSSNPFGFFSAVAKSASENSESSGYVDMTKGAEEKRRKLAKRLTAITEKLEELSNQIYHIQQRIELLERKAGVGSGY